MELSWISMEFLGSNLSKIYNFCYFGMNYKIIKQMFSGKNKIILCTNYLEKKVGTQSKEKRAINKKKTLLNCDMTGENLFCVLAHSCFLTSQEFYNVYFWNIVLMPRVLLHWFLWQFKIRETALIQTSNTEAIQTRANYFFLLLFFFCLSCIRFRVR